MQKANFKWIWPILLNTRSILLDDGTQLASRVQRLQRSSSITPSNFIWSSSKLIGRNSSHFVAKRNIYFSTFDAAYFDQNGTVNLIYSQVGKGGTKITHIDFPLKADDESEHFLFNWTKFKPLSLEFGYIFYFIWHCSCLSKWESKFNFLASWKILMKIEQVVYSDKANI